MSRIKLIALDMDGTLLDSRKNVTPEVLDAINTAFDSGVEVVLSTGRCVPELTRYFGEIPRLRYAICVSGGYVYDVREQRCIVSHTIPPELCLKIMETGIREDVLIHFLALDSVTEASKMGHMDRYGMGTYQEMFQKMAVKTDNIFEYLKSHPERPVNKLNLYHASVEGRERSRERLSAMGLPIEMVYAERSSLECSPQGVTKGKGLLELCGHLGIPGECTAAVGDGDNDIAILRTAALPIAMGNANERVKALCRITVADCDHDGCAEAIRRAMEYE